MQKLKETLKKWIPTAISFGLSIHFILHNEWAKALATSLFTTGLALWAKFSGEFITTLKKGASDRGKNLATWMLRKFDDLVSRCKCRLIWYWWRLTSHFKSRYYTILKENCDTASSSSLRLYLNLPILSKVFVKLRIAVADPDTFERQGLVQEQSSSKRGNSIWYFLAATQDSIAIIGSPGSGKSTLLRHITLTYAENIQGSQHSGAPQLVPILLKLREIKDFIISNPSSSLVEAITQSIQEKLHYQNNNGEQIKKWFENQLDIGKCLVMFDGLDEVADVKQPYQEINQWISRQMSTYYKSRFIITSRPFRFGDNKSFLMESFKVVLETQPFDDEQIKQFIDSWYLHMERLEELNFEERENDKKNKLYKSDKKRQDTERRSREKANSLMKALKDKPDLMDMARNPLLLTLIAIVHRNRDQELPKKRVSLYKEICDLQLEKRQEAKKISSPIEIEADHKKAILQKIALKLMQNNENVFSPDFANPIIQSYFRNIQIKDINSHDFLKDIEEISGLLERNAANIVGEYNYKFTHLSFQEFFAAIEIKKLGREDLLVEKIDEARWGETILLYAACGSANDLFQEALRKGTTESLTLAFDLLDESECEIDSKLQEQLKALQNRGLASTSREEFPFWAVIILKGRIKKLVKYQDRMARLDPKYITNAEYQLFINEKLQAGEQHQPPHWEEAKFPKGDGQKPIVGVKFHDAEVFCEWLTQKWSDQFFRYRLPRSQEVQEVKESSSYDPEEGIGTWCVDGNKRMIGDISNACWDTYQKAANDIFANDCSLACHLASAIDHRGVQNIVHQLAPEAVFSEAVFSLDFSLVDELRKLNISKFDLVDSLGLVSELSGRSELDDIKAFQKNVKTSLCLTQDRDNKSISDLREKLQRANEGVSEADQDFAKAKDIAQKREEAYRQAQTITQEREEALRQARCSVRELSQSSNQVNQILNTDLNEINCPKLRELNQAREQQKLCRDKLEQAGKQQKSCRDKLEQARKKQELCRDELEQAHSRKSEHANAYECVREYSDRSEMQRAYLLLLSSFWGALSKVYKEKAEKRRFKFARQKLYEQKEKKYLYEEKKAFNLYTFQLLRDGRHTGKISVWEGIRIVREINY